MSMTSQNIHSIFFILSSAISERAYLFIKHMFAMNGAHTYGAFIKSHSQIVSIHHESKVFLIILTPPLITDNHSHSFRKSQK